MMFRSMAVLVAAALSLCPRDAAAQVLLNGDFELQANGVTPTAVGQIGVLTTVQGWTVGAPQNSGQAHAFAFIVDSNADSTGFGSENSPPNIKVWGPNSGSNNGFTGSPTGGNFLGVDGDYATATVSQTVTGLTIGQQYEVAFDWAGSQFTDQSGATTQWWEIGFAGTTLDTTHTAVPSRGFTGWMHEVMTFTATSTSSLLTLQAKATPFTNGAPAGLPPFLLIDGVSVSTTVAAVPEPGPFSAGLLVSTISVAIGVCRRIKGKVKV